jgi:hypothetical protein
MNYSRRRARAKKPTRLSRFQANAIYLAVVAAGLLPLLTLIVPAPGWVLTILNAPAALGCIFLGVGAASVFGKSLCLAWALFVGGWVRQSRSPVVLAATAAAHFLCLGGLARVWTASLSQ